MLLLLHREAFGVHCVILSVVAAGTYWTVGRAAYRKCSQRAFQLLITMFMAAYGCVLIGQKLATFHGLF